MAVDERARHRLYRRLEEVLGPEEAGTLMNHLPPAGLSGLATRDDLGTLRTEMAGMRTELIGRMESLEHRLTAQIEPLRSTPRDVDVEHGARGGCARLRGRKA